jgi:hypothetical protein
MESTGSNPSSVSTLGGMPESVAEIEVVMEMFIWARDWFSSLLHSLRVHRGSHVVLYALAPTFRAIVHIYEENTEMNTENMGPEDVKGF